MDILVFLEIACLMLGKSSKHILPNWWFDGDFHPMVQSVQNSQTKKQIHWNPGWLKTGSLYWLIVISNPPYIYTYIYIYNWVGLSSLISQGSLHYQPKQCSIIREILQNYHTFALNLIPPKWVPFNDPWYNPTNLGSIMNRLLGGSSQLVSS